MTAIAKGLVLTLAARAPEVAFTLFYFNTIRTVLCGYTVAHILIGSLRGGFEGRSVYRNCTGRQLDDYRQGARRGMASLN